MKRSANDDDDTEPTKTTDDSSAKQSRIAEEDSKDGEQPTASTTTTTTTTTATKTATKATVDTEKRRPTRKAIVLLMYSGTGHYGMQRNVGFSTIEGTLFDCLLAGDHISKEDHSSPGRLQFQRASKTDKGVSALAQVVSLKLDMSDVASLKADLKNRLPSDIRLLDIFRTTKNFNCKARVNHREYAYICPSYTFAPKSKPIDISYRIDAAQMELLRSCLSRYKGTRNYYNFTSGRQPGDASCNRYIIDFAVDEPFTYREGEFLTLRVLGQSFMLHQIRKMVGLAVAIVKGYCELSSMDAVFAYRRMDVPKAPGLGLLLNKIDYSAYNGKYAAELGYPTIDWDRYEDERSQFKSDNVMPVMYRGESEDHSMLEWLKTLPMHSYDYGRTDGPPVARPQQQQQQQQHQKEQPPQLQESSTASQSTS